MVNPMSEVPDAPVDGAAKSSSPLYLRIALVVALIIVLGAFFAFDLNRYVSYESLQSNRDMLLEFVEQNGFWAVLS